MGMMGFAGSTHSYVLRTGIGRDDLIDAGACAVAARDSARVLAAMKSISADCGWRSILLTGRGLKQVAEIARLVHDPIIDMDSS
jgi:hypothetical protein